MTDSIIRRFKLEGIMADDSLFVHVQNSYKKVIEAQMRDEGFVPLYDIDPVFRSSYNVEKNHYDISYTMQGVYVGEEKSWNIRGVVNNRVVEKSTPTNQSK